jgi:transposase
MRPSKTALTDYLTRNSGVAKYLYLAFELGSKRWRLCFTDGERLREKTLEAHDLKGLEREIGRSKERFKLSEAVEVLSCYEAGRDAFWLHRYLEAQGVTNLVVDSSSIKVDRRKRRAKTDRLDARDLLLMLVRYLNPLLRGDRKIWQVVRVPSEQDEAERRLSRERDKKVRDRTALRARIRSLLATQGLRLKGAWKRLPRYVEDVRDWDGRSLSEELREELLRLHAQERLVQEQILVIERRQRERLDNGTSRKETMARCLYQLRAVGLQTSWTLTYEYLGWRKFRNSREVGAGAGLTPTPYQSDQMRREQGISKAGNPRIRKLMVELAWRWVQFQPEHPLSRWYFERFGEGKRVRKIGIVALARRLLVFLWKYVERGEVTEHTLFKVA